MPAVPSSPPLVLLPGMNCSARLWGPAGAGALHPVLDRPTLDEQVQALLDALPDRFALGGLSLGGIVAMALTRRAPERVAGLCLMATNARAPTPEQRAGWDAALTRLDDGAPARALQPLELLLHDRSLDATALQMADETGERRLAAQLRLQGTRVDERPALPAVAVPTLVLAGEQDRLCPGRAAHRDRRAGAGRPAAGAAGRRSPAPGRGPGHGGGTAGGMAVRGARALRPLIARVCDPEPAR